MKKIIIAVFMSLSIIVCSCANDIDKFLDSYDKLANEMVEACKEGDTTKMVEIEEKAESLKKQYPDIKPESFSEKQKERLLSIVTKIWDASQQMNLGDTTSGSESDSSIGSEE